MFYGYECAMGYGWVIPLVFFALMVFCMFRVGRNGGMCGFAGRDKPWKAAQEHERQGGRRSCPTCIDR